MNKKDFMFSIGFRDDTAVVDKKAKNGHSSYSFQQLLDEGLFKQALCSALYDENDSQVEAVVEAYNKISGSSYKNKLQICRLFGVFSVPEDGVKSKRL
jgi:hypothetical protein